MWITIIDRTKRPAKTQAKPADYYLRFKGLPYQVEASQIQGLPFKLEILPQGNSAIVKIRTEQQEVNVKKAISDSLNLVPLLFAEKIKVKIPNAIIFVILFVAIALLVIGFVLGRVI